ncbi:MAG: glycerophosphoryl diester phosphodiesterase [Microbacterium sp.]|nr:glycerophosphoryl diester phosphodiesterase [Microbacterium sp.]
MSVTAPASSLITVVATGLLAAVPQAPASVPAEASSLVGEPVLHLIESVHAPGKVIELGNASAQPTLSTREPAAAAVFSMGRTPDAVRKQALALYPVTGATDTYVIAAADGRVLARRQNSSPDFRYLELRDTTVDDAAADPYAQWTVTAGTGGVSYIRNVQRDNGGGVAGLDLYNWATADASEVQTYTAGTAAVQQWRLRTLAPTVASVTEVVEIGREPVLPTSLRATYSFGPRVDLAPIVWQRPAAEAWQTEGSVTVTGSASGYFGEPVPVTAEYTVGTLAADVAATMSAYAGVTVAELRMRAPATVERAVSGSDTTVTAPVRWDWSAVADADFAAAGTVTVPAASGLGFAATLTIDVRPAAQVNILRGAGVHADYTFKDGTAFALTDGVRDRTGFADWRSGGAANRVNPNTISFYLDEPRQITGASVFDIGGQNNIGGVTVQYRDIRGGWVDLPADGTSWPHTNTTPTLNLEVNGAPVLATGVRVIVTNKSANTWMTLSEIEVRGPAAAPAASASGATAR